jgi:tRNA (adenine57-N1/adenine58-N1)-methyltransferase
MIPENTLVMLYAKEDGKKFFVTLQKEYNFGTHLGNIPHSTIMEKSFGEEVATHIDKQFLIIRPSLYDIIMNIKRHTQIVYPKDIGYILLKLGIRNGDRIIEAGTGSGSLTIALAYAAAPDGMVTTYERREEFSQKAEKNLERAGIRNAVEMKVRDVAEEGFDETEVDAVFLDMKDPSASIEHAFKALRPGGNLGLLLPTTNQVCDALEKLETLDFIETEVLELMIRRYKLNAARLRPQDTMVGHTGFLVFAKKGIPLEENQG